MLQLHVRPVVQGIANRFGDGPGPGFEFFEVGGVARAKTLRHAVSAHRPPFIVIAVEPDFRHGAEAMVVPDLIHRKMAVIVDDRQRLRDLVKQVSCELCLEQKVLVNKRRAHDAARSRAGSRRGASA